MHVRNVYTCPSCGSTGMATMWLLGWTSSQGTISENYNKRSPWAASPRIYVGCLDCNAKREATWPITWVRSFLDGLSHEVRQGHPAFSVRRWGKRKISFDLHAERFEQSFHFPWNDYVTSTVVSPGFKRWVSAGEEFMRYDTCQLYWRATLQGFFPANLLPTVQTLLRTDDLRISNMWIEVPYGFKSCVR